jgi:hypothetical protein
MFGASNPGIRIDSPKRAKVMIAVWLCLDLAGLSEIFQ